MPLIRFLDLTELLQLGENVDDTRLVAHPLAGYVA